MKQRNKLLSLGLLLAILSVLFINGFIQFEFSNTLYNKSNLGSGASSYPTFGNADYNWSVLYGHPTELKVTKSESVTIDLFPNGTIKSQKVNVGFIFKNDARENCSFDLIDRLEECDLDTIKFQKGTFPSVLKYQVLASDKDFGVIVLKWSNINVSAKSRAEYGYTITSYKAVPIAIETKYYINGTLQEIDPIRNEIKAGVGSVISNIICVRNIQQGLYSSNHIVKPTTLCLITLMLPFSEKEKDRDIAEPIFNRTPISSNVIGPIQQVSWLALGDKYVLNWTTVILKGGGWGIIELQPLRFDIMQSAGISQVLFDGLSALLGILAAQQIYWASLTLMAMVEELSGMVGVLQLLLTDIQTQLGMLTMINYSLINALLISLIEIDMTKTSLQRIYSELYTIYNNHLLPDYGIFDLTVLPTMRRVLGLGLEGLLTNGTWLGPPYNTWLGLGYPYMSLPLLIEYYSDIERRIVASFGAQLIEILGNPALINITSTTQNFQFLVNATITRLSNNSTNFYVLINVVNLTLSLFNIGGYSIIPLNLTRRYEFKLNDVPGDVEIFNAIDNYFGHPVVSPSLFPNGYQAPGSPGSSLPGFYTWMLNLIQIGRSALWWTIGNLTRSLATLMLLLDSSFSPETLQTLNNVLHGRPIDTSIPITMETGFKGMSDLMNIFSKMAEQFKSPFGNPLSGFILDTNAFNIPTSNANLALLNNFGFWTALKLYIEPVPRLRNLLNITLPLNLGNITSAGGGIGAFGFAKSAENGLMGNWNNFSIGLNSTNLIQKNLKNASLDYKQIQFKATGNVNSGIIYLNRSFNYTIPATQVIYRIRTNITSPILSIVVISQNASGKNVYAIYEHPFSALTSGWHEFSFDLRQSKYSIYYDNSFDPEKIIGVQLRITPKVTSAGRLEIDYINFTRSIIPYPYDIRILDNYMIGTGVEILPNITVREKWTSGLSITTFELKDLTGDGIADIIAGSNDHNLYCLNGRNGTQLWNFSADGAIRAICIEDIVSDPNPEILFGTDKGTIYILNKNGNALWNFSIGSNFNSLIFAKLTADRNSSILISRNNNLIAFNNANYTGVIYWSHILKGNITNFVVGDVNGDGVKEIGVATSKYKIYLLNGTNGNVLWDTLTEELPTHLLFGNFKGDSKKELLYSTDQEYGVILDGLHGTQLSSFTTKYPIGGLFLANLTGDSYDDILISTGTITPYNLSAIAGNSLNLLWNFISPFGFSTIMSANYNSDNYDEVIVTTINNTLYLLDNSGILKFNFSLPRSVNQVALSNVTQDSIKDFVFAASSNHLLTIDGKSRKQLWNSEIGEEIITFQFIRTSNTVQLLYNLADPLTEILAQTGFSLFGAQSLTAQGALGSLLGSTSAGSLGGLGSIDLSAFNLPLKGIGLLNMLEMEITLIANLQDMKTVSMNQKAYTGIDEIRYTDKDTIDYQLYPLIIQASNAEYIQYKLRNRDQYPITIHHFALNITWKGQPLPLDRIFIEGWNGTQFVNLENNPIDNISMSYLGLNYTNGKLLFKPGLKVEELDKVLLTIDWMGRELRVKINTTNIPPAELSIEPWVDVSIELPGITLSSITTVISYSKNHPAFLVSSIPAPNITGETKVPSLLELMVTNPAFWAFFSVVLVSFIGFEYMHSREQKAVKVIAAQKIIKWMKRREKSWRTLLKARIMSESQYFGLQRIQYRIRKENLMKNTIQTMFEKILRWKLIGTFISTIFLIRFWRDVNKKSRLIWILLTLENMVTTPLKQAWKTFKTALGYLNPMDLNRQKKKDLLKKASKKHYWKKIEPPQKPIRKQRVEIISAPQPTLERLKLPKKKKKGWTSQYRYDGGKLLAKISRSKKLPPIGSREGLIFYTISKRKFVGITLNELSKELNLPEYEILVSLIRLYEKGLIFMLQEGKILSEDLWDIASSFRKSDVEMEKLIESTEKIEDELKEGIQALQIDLKNTKNFSIENQHSDQGKKNKSAKK